MESTIKTNESSETNEGTMNLPELAAFVRAVRAEGLAVLISEDGEGKNATRLNFTWEGFFRSFGVEPETAKSQDSDRALQSLTSY